MTVVELILVLLEQEPNSEIEIFNPTTFLRYDVEKVIESDGTVTIEVGEPTSL